MLWDKMDSLVLRNFHDYWEDPLINKYLGEEASKHFEGLLILRKNKKQVWLSHPFNYEQAKKVFSKNSIVKTYSSMKDIEKILKKETGKVVGYNPRHQTVLSFRNLKKFLKGKKLVNAEGVLETDREIKTKNEIQRITTASKETRKVINKIPKWIKKGITEKRIEEKITAEFKNSGFDTSFCIIAFSENSSHIHHSPTNKKFTGGIVLIDVGAKYKGYSADQSATIWIGEKKGKKYEEFIREYKKVKECLENIESILKEGNPTKKLWDYTKPLGELPHSLGHGVGVEVHDFPSGIGKKSDWKLKEGMVLAIEPALYNKKFGIRIENTYLITKKGYKIL